MSTMRAQNDSPRMYVADEFLHHITGMAVSNHNFAIDSICTHRRCDFTESLACYSDKSLSCCLSSICNKYDGSIQRAGFDRLNHVAENKRGPTCFALRFDMWDKIVDVSQSCCH